MSYHPIGACCASCATGSRCASTGALGMTGGNAVILNGTGGKMVGSGQQTASPVNPLQNLPTDRLPLYLAGIGAATLGLVLFLTRRR